MQPNVLEVDLDAVAHNICALRRHVGPGVQVFAALKANAYGFGVERVAHTAIEAGVDALALVDVTHAIALRRLGIRVPILLYGGIPADADLVARVEEHDLTPTLLDVDDLHTYEEHATGRLQAFVKVDVGLERLGTHPEDIPSIPARLRNERRVKVRGVYTHLHVPPRGQDDGSYLRWQFQRFVHALDVLRDHGIEPQVRMAASSAVLIQTDQMSLNAIDPGHLLFGMYPSGPRVLDLHLRPAFLSLKSRLVQVKAVQRSAFVEQAPFPIRPGMRIGVFPFGLAHGMLQAHCGQVLVRGRRVPVLGVSLEHTRVDVTDGDAHAGDEVVIVGRQETEEISPAEVQAHQSQHIPSALPLAIHSSVPRFYMEGVVGD
jgi:alanine racemase